MPNQRPNILIFMTDQEQAQVVAAGHHCRTPNADRLAADGVRFNRCFTVTAHCCPSRATFMTGLNPTRHGVYNNICNAPAIHTAPFPGTRHFSEDLRQAGYKLSYSGKWHVSNEANPAAFGWEETDHVSSRANTAYERNWHAWINPPANRVDKEIRSQGDLQRPGWGTYRLFGVTDKSLESLEDYKIAQAGIAAMQRFAAEDGPWCVYIGTHGPHDPYVVPRHYAEMYDPADVPLPASYTDTLDDKPRVYRRLQRQVWSQLSEQEVRQAIALYWGYCTMMDDLLGMVLDALDRTGQADNTLVVFTSDHGDYMGAHGLFMKGVAAFDEAYNTPCIMRWPAGIKQAGRESDALVSIADFAHTFLDVAGCVPERGFNGRSLVPLLQNTNTPADWREAVFMQLNGLELYYTQRTVRSERYKYVFNGFDDDELYDLQEDPAELTNLANNPAYEEVKRHLVGLMWQYAAESNDTMQSPYPTVALVPYGPMIALKERK